MIKRIIVYQCPNCEEIMLSNNWEPPELDYCKCRFTACDMGVDYTRWKSEDVIKLKAKVWDLQELLKEEGEDKQCKH